MIGNAQRKHRYLSSSGGKLHGEKVLDQRVYNFYRRTWPAGSPLDFPGSVPVSIQEQQRLRSTWSALAWPGDGPVRQFASADIGGVEAAPHEPVSLHLYSPPTLCSLAIWGVRGFPKDFDPWGSPRKTWDCDTPRISTEPLTRPRIPKFSLIASFSALARAETANCGASIDQIDSFACRVPNPAVGVPKSPKSNKEDDPHLLRICRAVPALLHTQARRGSTSSRMASSPESSPMKGPMSVNGGYKRASRKGAPRRFPCEHPSCDKIYSRAEHLQRHQLNRETFPRLNPQLCCIHSVG